MVQDFFHVDIDIPWPKARIYILMHYYASFKTKLDHHFGFNQDKAVFNQYQKPLASDINTEDCLHSPRSTHV